MTTEQESLGRGTLRRAAMYWIDDVKRITGRSGNIALRSDPSKGNRLGIGKLRPSSTMLKPCKVKTLQISRFVMKLRRESGMRSPNLLASRSSGAHNGLFVVMMSKVFS